jgi:DNA-binding beta-propeller fold protein YncE
MMRAVNLLGRTLITLVVGVLMLAAAASAGAYQTHVFEKSFAGVGEHALSGPRGVAIDQAGGDVYVVDGANDRVEVFNASGGFVSAFGKEGSGEGELKEPSEIAVDNSMGMSQGDVYVLDGGNQRIEVFNSTGAYLSQITGAELEKAAGAPERVRGLGVDGSGNLWISAELTRGGNAGALIVFERPLTGSLRVAFKNQKIAESGFALAPDGDLWAANGAGAVSYGPNGEETAFGDVGLQEAAARTTAVALDPGEDVYVGRGDEVAEFTPGSMSARFRFGSSGPGALVAGAGMAVSSATGSVYVADTDSNDVDVYALAPEPEKPSTEAAKEVTATTAVLRGELKGKAGERLKYYFEYNAGASCTGGSRTPEGESEVGKEVSTEVTGLAPDTEYSDCVVAVGVGEALGNAVPFETLPAPPEIVSESAAVQATSAKLGAKIKPNSQKTSYEFEYATSEAAIGTVSATKIVGAGTIEGAGEDAVSVETGDVLSAGTVYYYRVLAEGTATHVKAAPGKIEQFTTAITPETPSGLQASPVGASRATLTGVLNPGGPGDPGTYEFLYERSATECQGAGHVSVLGAATGASAEPVHTEVTGLLAHTTYTFCLIARNDVGESSLLAGPKSFTTLAAAPAIEEQFTTEVASTSATLSAKIYPGGSPTTYAFEYAPAGGEFKRVPEPDGRGSGSVGEGAVGVPVRVHVQEGLAPASAYEFRVVVSNAVQQGVAGEPVAFTTQQSGEAPTLLDARQYEMVSPPAKQGAQIEGIAPGFASVQAAGSGDAITYGSLVPDESEPSGFNYSVQNLSTRAGAGSWQTRDLTVPHSEAVGSQFAAGSEYQFFSSDLSHSVVHPAGLFTPCENAEGASQPCMSPEASEEAPFLTTNFFNGNVSEACLPRSMHCAQPLVSGCPLTGPCARMVEEHADTPPGTVFGGRFGGGAEEELRECTQLNSKLCGPQFVAATPDLSHVLIRAKARLTTEAPPSESGQFGYLYEWSGGRLQYVGQEGRPFEGLQTEADGFDTISADGTRVLFATKDASERPVLMRDTAAGETVEIGEPGAETQFEASSSDFSRVFFRPQPLASLGSVEEGALDVFEVTSAPGAPLAGKVTSLTGGADLIGNVLGTSEDGSYVYFVSNAVLASGATTGSCKPISSIGVGFCNLYVDHYNGSEWKPTFIATLAGGDVNDWVENLRERPVRVSPNGQWLAFMSEASLTGYDNRDVSNGRPDAEVYLYHTAVGGGAASLSCASCEPTGARPTGIEYSILRNVPDQNEDAWDETGMVAAYLPGWQGTGDGEGPDDYQSRYLSDSGRLFFTSVGSLVPDDVDGTQDVYEYEPEGVGDCTAMTSSGSSVFVPAREFDAQGDRGVQDAACVGLVSSGTSSSPSLFLDASETGGDVFFLTAAKLAAQDADSAYDVYDAHECTGVSPCASTPVGAPACETEASCRPSPTPQPLIYSAPASATFNGPGNVTPTTPSVSPPSKKVVGKKVKCGKGRVKSRHGKCVKRARKKAKKARKATRRAGR